jgi:Fe-S cluster biogenesis protein NfuA
MLVESEQISQVATAEAERIRLITEVIEEIRPNLRRDGGDCELVEICGNKVMVKLTGACVFCKLSSATLEGIQARIVEKLGEFMRLSWAGSRPRIERAEKEARRAADLSG